MDDLAGFLSLVSAMGGKSMLVPPADAEDARLGATSIPAEVTMARREGKKAIFNQNSHDRASWYWQIEGSNERILHG